MLKVDRQYDVMTKSPNIKHDMGNFLLIVGKKEGSYSQNFLFREDTWSRDPLKFEFDHQTVPVLALSNTDILMLRPISPYLMCVPSLSML